jgi:MinD-like ATPase involved in chromosome partitioning or flagellar assembly
MFDNIFSDSLNKEDSNTHIAYIFGVRTEQIISASLKEMYSDVIYKENEKDIDLSAVSSLFFYAPDVNVDDLNSFFYRLVDKYNANDNVFNIVVIGELDSLSVMSAAKELGITYFTSKTFPSLIDTFDYNKKRSVSANAHSVLVLGMSGGVGASTISSSLVKLMAESGKSSLMVDCNGRYAIQPALLDVMNHPPFDPSTVKSISLFDFRLTKCYAKNFSLFYCKDRAFSFDSTVHQLIISKNRYVVSDVSVNMLCDDVISRYKKIILVVNSGMNSFIQLSDFWKEISNLDIDKFVLVYNNTNEKATTILLSDYKKTFGNLDVVSLPYVELKPSKAEGCFSDFLNNKEYLKKITIIFDSLFSSESSNSNQPKKSAFDFFHKKWRS